MSAAPNGERDNTSYLHSMHACNLVLCFFIPIMAVGGATAASRCGEAKEPKWIFLISASLSFRTNQGRSAAGLDWDGLGALGHGVPVLGVDGYEYVRSRNWKS